MGIFGKKSDAAPAANETVRHTAPREHSAPREEGQAALTPEDVHDRADAAESAATRPLRNESAGSTDSVVTHDHFQGAAAPDAAAESADDASRRRAIAERAYYKAQQRGFAPGHEEADWLDAENEENQSGGRSNR